MRLEEGVPRFHESHHRGGQSAHLVHPLDYDSWHELGHCQKHDGIQAAAQGGHVSRGFLRAFEQHSNGE